VARGLLVATWASIGVGGGFVGFYDQRLHGHGNGVDALYEMDFTGGMAGAGLMKRPTEVRVEWPSPSSGSSSG
jgi:hypothetical protein